jgi:hypothetical protein
MPVPELHPDVRRAAVEKATAARQERARLKARLRTGAASFDDVLSAAVQSEAIAKLRVSEVVESMPGYGPVTARRLMERLDIAASRRVRGLGPRQRAALLDAFGGDT